MRRVLRAAGRPAPASYLSWRRRRAWAASMTPALTHMVRQPIGSGRQQPATVTIEKAGGSAVPASSMLMLMTLGAGHGDEVTLRAEGEGAEESVNALADLLEKDLDAEE